MSSHTTPPTTQATISRDYAFRFLIAAKAAIVEVPEWCEPQGWWETEGRLWLGELSKRLDVDLEWLPPEPTPADVATFANEIPPEEHQSLVLSLLSICLLASTAISPNTHGEKSTLLNYSASTRTFLCQTLTLLSVDQKYLLLAEDIVADGLYNELKVAQMKAKSDAARKEQEQGWGGKWGRWAATAGGVILGGLAIGLTSGLAAPALLPLLPFLTASSAPVVIGTLFGLTGGGLAGLRVNKRWAGVDTFEFIQITGGAEDGDSGSILSQEGAMDNTRAPSLVATILVPGILLESENEAVDGLRQCAHLFSFPRRDTFVLSHSPSTMLSTGRSLQGWIKNTLLATLPSEVIKRTALQTVLGVVSLPMQIYQATGVIVDNEWIRGCDRARKAGRLLAGVLRDKVQGERPVVLIGYSLGALVLFEALKSLAQDTTQTKSPLVDSVIFISLPVAPARSEWRAVRNMVGRRLVNAYCETDLVLAGVARLHEVLGGKVTKMAGLGPVAAQINGLENIDLDGIIDGHFELNNKIDVILERVGANS